MSSISAGRDLFCTPDITECVRKAIDSGFTFIVAPLVHPRYYRNDAAGVTKQRDDPLTRSDMLLSTNDWGTVVVGKLSPWICLHSAFDSARKNAEKVLLEELDYAVHLSLAAVEVPLKSADCANLARGVNEFLNSRISNMTIWVKVPMMTLSSQMEDAVAEGDEDSRSEHPWEWWNRFRTLCNNNKRVGIALELSADLPESDEIDQWYSEPVKALYVPTKIFLTNRKGFPVLSPAHQAVVRKFYKLEAQPVVTGACHYKSKGMKVYQQYLNYLHETMAALDPLEEYAKGYEDYLQNPLQPLMDNLESMTYETFEKDPVKYTMYHKAIYEALLDRVGDDEAETVTTVVMVVGAGRGPLVRATLQAGEKARRLVRVYAIEKNVNAVVTLRNMKREEWHDQVTVVSCDMRHWQAPEKADILVSELLGSFGDNELSPECLDGAQTFLKADGISIPCQYTSYLAPLSSAKLHSDLAIPVASKDPLANYETSYVVQIRNGKVLDAPQPCFTFSHPNWASTINNDRYKRFTFQIDQKSMLHGFSGYFETILYKNTMLSTVPATHSKGMFSWFPIYFPIKEPMYLDGTSPLEVHFWRRRTRTKVWYEWAIVRPRTTPIHNVGGRSHSIGL
ncbi:protein arginine N-methyltransferase 5-like [Oscarella lobularis]|uniref:protein arginine N-methyltransferase 5-like n=1 Tax=Oscarella lobularis TaxID=121494 RepID=UPI0033130BD0